MYAHSKTLYLQPYIFCDCTSTIVPQMVSKITAHDGICEFVTDNLDHKREGNLLTNDFRNRYLTSCFVIAKSLPFLRVVESDVSAHVWLLIGGGVTCPTYRSVLTIQKRKEHVYVALDPFWRPHELEILGHGFPFLENPPKWLLFVRHFSFLLVASRTKRWK